jgi:hypothetical protein
MTDEDTLQIADELRRLEDEAAGIERQREARANAERLPYERQRLADLKRVNELEEEHGTYRVGVAKLRGWVPGKGAATLVVVVVPTRSSHRYQKFQQQIIAHRKDPSSSVRAIEELGRMTIAYPHHERDKALYDATLELAPVMLNTAADIAAKLADADDQVDAKKLQRS